jgi:hypothetical protein
MKCSKVLFVLAAAVLVSGGSAFAVSGDNAFQVNNRLRLEYDDNIYDDGQDQQSSFKVLEEIEFLVNMSLPQTFVGVRYRPTLVYWEDRPGDSTDVDHDFDLILSQNFSPRVSLALKDTFRRGEIPQVIDRGTIVQQQDTFNYNVADGNLAFRLQPSTRLEAAGRYTLLRYDDDVVAENYDFDIYSGGLTLRHEVNPDLQLLGELRHEDISYTGPDRGAVSEYIGVGLENIFNPALLANLRGGVQMKEFNDDSIDSKTAPYVDASLTVMPSPATRITAGAGYSMYESDVFPYASQDRVLGFISLAHDVTARLSAYLSGSYQVSDYSGDETIAADGSTSTAADGTEEVTQFSARAAYKVNRSNWLEAEWQYLNLTSDLRDDFDRTRVSIGWRVSI